MQEIEKLDIKRTYGHSLSTIHEEASFLDKTLLDKTLLNNTSLFNLRNNTE